MKKILISFFILMMSFSAVNADSIKCGEWVSDAQYFIESHRGGRILDSDFISLIENKGFSQCHGTVGKTSELVDIFLYYSKIKKSKDFDVLREVVESMAGKKKILKNKIASALEIIYQKKTFTIDSNRDVEKNNLCRLREILVEIGWKPGFSVNDKKSTQDDYISTRYVSDLFGYIKDVNIQTLREIWVMANKKCKK